MKLAVFVSLLASAAAFAPVQQARSSTALNADYSKELGAQVPLGCFDPLGLLKKGDLSQERFDELRYLELKHGRVAMLAFMGNIAVLGGMRFPGMLSSDIAFADMPSHGLEALSKVPDAGITQILLFLFCMEVGMTSRLDEGEFKGDFTTVVDFGWNKWDDATKMNKRAIELNNGRAAMMGITGLIVHESIGNLDSMPIISL
mmetsp:Transcript_31053/g.57377  ORF Transcript_31053/g.57377 Transcript_31053/m.57377 type:complete len:202 (-) Transcript_31053:377-982(-)|eukprot:CAMPEP_0197440462 /NCGR_PEP_ID=MMETSP1175-20131217/6971_1 /TAXON_ID=1003142 /ORGANISM="Triceratium dubium, Strain CCMP147" /LENGTH=201 /DNA_ID=CAMNT_0042970569 /DNA_START=67 /DNA_END=672 /DNA_ORIENTATION=+